jgi:hypothetical protein
MIFVSIFHISIRTVLNKNDWHIFLTRFLDCKLAHFFNFCAATPLFGTGPERLRCLHAVWTEYKPFLDQLSSSEHLAEDKAYDEDKFDETMGRDQEQQYRDDLRAGAFQFVEASGSREDLPLPYQVA